MRVFDNRQIKLITGNVYEGEEISRKIREFSGYERVVLKSPSVT